MRELPCPYCKRSIKFSWADFVFLSNRGKSDLFCLGCKKLCTIDNATSFVSLVAGISPVVAVYLLLFASGMFSLPKYIEVSFVLCALPVVMFVRAIATEKFAELMPKQADELPNQSFKPNPLRGSA